MTLTVKIVGDKGKIIFDVVKTDEKLKLKNRCDMTEFFVSSAKALNTTDARKEKSRYPWWKAEVGFSFVVKKDEIKLNSLKSLAYRWGKRNDRLFRVVEHEDVYEVARIK